MPSWAEGVLTDDAIHWLAGRWDPDLEEFTFDASDQVTLHRDSSNYSVITTGMQPRALVEMLSCIWIDRRGGVRGRPSEIRTIVREAVAGDASSLNHLTPDDLAAVPRVVLKRWQGHLDFASADPEREWQRDVVRLAVVKPGARRATFRLGEVTQPWLREMATVILRTHLNSVADGTLGRYAIAAIRLSEFLRTRTDGGQQPSRLSANAMDRFVAWLDARDSSGSAVKEVSAFLNLARVLGVYDRYGIPATFAVRDHHIPESPRRDRTGDRGFPEATFRFLLGMDDLLGERVLDLARSVPDDNFSGEAFVVAIQLAANFGRRPDELLSLPADRLQTADNGRAELLYDNFKSGRERVWLPVDARAAALVQDWLPRLRSRYPATPLDRLRLLPRPNRNPDGTQPLAPSVFSWWFRVWLTLLEEAMILGRLRAATGLSLDTLCGLTMGHVRDSVITVDGTTHQLGPEDAQALIDYRAEVLARVSERKYSPADPQATPLFPDPFVRTGGQGDYAQRAFVPVAPSRFDALGYKWWRVTALYPSGGIPGANLGSRRAKVSDCTPRLFRHTYLQHLVDLGTDIFLVQELADHQSVKTTIESYVRVHEEKLREAVDRLAAHRLNRFGQPVDKVLPLISAPARDVGTNSCLNPQVLALGKEGCDYDRLCFDCGHIAADPSNIPDIKSEIHTCNITLARLQAESATGPVREAHITMLRARREGWNEMLRTLTQHLEELEPAEREKVETAAVGNARK